MTLRNLCKPLNVTDITVVIFLTFLSFVVLIFHQRVTDWILLIGINTVSSIALIFFCRYAENKTGVMKWLRDFYMVAGIPLVFKELYLLVHPIHPFDYDQLLINIDHWLFGANPTQWLYQFSTPLLTEILQLAYSSFYFLMLIFGIDLYQRKNKDAFEYGLYSLVYGFFLSYIGYMLVPAVGPRFTLHDFTKINTDLPGLFFTPILRSLINLGESIPDGTLNALALVQRDVFPSGHTQMTLILMFVAWKYKCTTRWFLWITGSLLIIGTMYLRYHYVIDVIAGAAFMIFTMWTVPMLQRKWNKWIEKSKW